MENKTTLFIISCLVDTDVQTASPETIFNFLRYEQFTKKASATHTAVKKI
jgi:hypothetical protein